MVCLLGSILFCHPTPVFFTPPVTKYMLLYNTLLCNKISRATLGVKDISPLGWGEQNRKDPLSRRNNCLNNQCAISGLHPTAYGAVKNAVHLNRSTIAFKLIFGY